MASLRKEQETEAIRFEDHRSLAREIERRVAVLVAASPGYSLLPAPRDIRELGRWRTLDRCSLVGLHHLGPASRSTSVNLRRRELRTKRSRTAKPFMLDAQRRLKKIRPRPAECFAQGGANSAAARRRTTRAVKSCKTR